MDIMELGAIGELVGGVAVVGSLLYVGLQIRHNTAVSRARSHQAFNDSINQINLEMVRDPSVAEVWLGGSANRSALSETDCLRFDLLMLSIFHVFETRFYQSRVGAGDRHLSGAEERSIETLFSMQGVRSWWGENPFSFGGEFRGYLDSFSPTSTIERKA